MTIAKRQSLHNHVNSGMKTDRSAHCTSCAAGIQVNHPLKAVFKERDEDSAT